MKAYKKEIQEQANTDLINLGQMMDSELQTIATTADQIRMSMDFDGYRFTENPLRSRNYVDQLKVYSVTNPLLSETAIYLRGEDYMFMNQSTCPVDFFLNNMYLFEKTSSEEMRDLLFHGSHRTILPEQKVTIPGRSDSFLVILEPLYTDYESVQGMCLFFIRSADLERFADSRLNKYEAYFSIEDAEGNLLFSSNTMPEEPYITSRYDSSQTGCVYTAYIPESLKFVKKIEIISHELFSVTLFVLLISLIVLILSCALGWCVAKISLKLKHKNFTTVIASLLFLAAYYWIYFKAQTVINDLMENAIAYGNKVKDSAYVFYLFGRIGEGDPLAMLSKR